MFYYILLLVFYINIVIATNLRNGNIENVSNSKEKCTNFIGIPLCYDSSIIYNIYTRILTSISNNNFKLFNYIYVNKIKNVTFNNITFNKIKNVSNNINNYINNHINDYINDENICSKENQYTLLPFKFNLLIENIYVQDAVFSYYVITDYGCTLNYTYGLQPNNVTLMIPTVVNEKYIQKSQYILIDRFYGSMIDNATIKIYNPFNSLKFKDSFMSFIKNNTLYIFPWVRSVSNNMINIEYTSYYTNIYIQKIGITKIGIVFNDFYRILLRDKNIYTYMHITTDKQIFYPFI